jgi:hypothetical protein
MKAIDATYAGTVANLNDRTDLQLISNSQDIEQIKHDLGDPEWFDFGCLFVSINEGEYDEIYGCDESTPWLSAAIYKVIFDEVSREVTT